MSQISDSTTLLRSASIVAADMDGETVMMSIDRGAYFGLGGVGARVWELLAQPTSLAQLTEVICSEFDVDAATCASDLQRFIGDLQANGLVSAH